MSESLRRPQLQRRAELLRRLRQFFDERGFLEVETPLLETEIIPELHIEPFAVDSREAAIPFWLQASPELHMKRLLAEGFTAIYQVTRSFRRGERGQLHNPEFTIAEWYRVGDGMQEGMELLDELCQMIADAPPATRTSYGEAFERYAGIDPHRATPHELARTAHRLHVSMPAGFEQADRDEWLNVLLAVVVEPQLGAAGPEILYHYPATQSSLAATTIDAEGNKAAERFELYWRGVELANGYHELTDPAALRRRLEEVNRQRTADHRPALPLPEKLLAAMENPGLPSCTGCALGFDRLVMLTADAASIDQVMTFPHDD